MVFASVEWYLMVEQTILAVFKENGVTPTPETIAKSLHIAREEGGSVVDLRAYVKSLKPQPGPDPGPSPTPILTRDQVCAVQLTFQGLVVQTEQFGTINWFEPALFALTHGDRKKVYEAKKAAGDTHVIFGFDDQGGPIYRASPYDQMNSYNFENQPDAYKAALLEVRQAGFIPCVFLGGDDGENGYPLAVRQLPKAYQWMKDAGVQGLIVPGWDGVFYGWTPAHIDAFGAQFRALDPPDNICLGIEHQPGRIPVGNGPSDWGNPDVVVEANGARHGCMQAYDVLLTEFHDLNLREDSTWQVAGRTLGPAYHRDPAQQGDTNPPFYLKTGTPRGPYYVIAFEYEEFEWVWKTTTQASIQANRAYLKSLGYTYVC